MIKTKPNWYNPRALERYVKGSFYCL